MVLFRSLPAVILLGLFLAGCAAGAKMQNMVVNQEALVSSAIDTPFMSALHVQRVSGGCALNTFKTFIKPYPPIPQGDYRRKLAIVKQVYY